MQKFYRSWVETRRTRPGEWPRIKETISAIERSAFKTSSLKSTKWDLRETFRDKKSICIIAKYNNRIIGYISGRPLEEYSYMLNRNHERNIGKRNTIYIESIAVKPLCHGNGVGTKLLRAFMREAKRQKYTFVSGNFRRGPSTYIFLFEGGRKISITKNYAGTGETYYYCRMRVRNGAY